MAKYKWPEVQVPKGTTDPDEVRRSLAPVFGDAISQIAGEAVRNAIQTYGLDSVDRRYLRGLPGQPDPNGQPNGAAYSQFDCIDRGGWQIPQVRAHRYRLMESWFRFVLNRVPFEKSLGVDNLDPALHRTLSTTDSEGGYLIPPGFIPQVTMDIPKLSQLFQYVRVIPVPGLHGIMPKVGTNATVYWCTENSDFTDGDPAFGDTEYTVNRVNALVRLSREIVADSNPDIVGVVTTLFQRAMVEERDRVIAVGSGSGKPLGLYSAAGIIEYDFTALNYANLVKLKNSIDQRYQFSPSFRWTMNQNVLAQIFEITDTLGRPIFREAMGDEPAKILNVPYSIERSFPDNYVGIGDLQYYIWFDRQQMGAETSTEGDAFLKHQLWLKWFERVDGKPVLPPTSPMARCRLLTGVTHLTPSNYPLA